MIVNLVHDDQSWATMAKAFFKAGIKYRAGENQDGMRWAAARSLFAPKFPSN
jgi:hypothetical protein